MNFENHIKNFMTKIATGEIEVYNEFSLQHELGIYLRDKFPEDKVEFERNTTYFGIHNLIKHEIDIVAYSNNKKKKYALELKYPRNGQYPEQMFNFIKDIKFMEQLKEKGFNETYCLALVADKLFYSGSKKDGIYKYFRNGEKICGAIKKPTGKNKEEISIHSQYNVEWVLCGDYNYYFIKI